MESPSSYHHDLWRRYLSTSMPSTPAGLFRPAAVSVSSEDMERLSLAQNYPRGIGVLACSSGLGQTTRCNSAVDIALVHLDDSRFGISYPRLSNVSICSLLRSCIRNYPCCSYHFTNRHWGCSTVSTAADVGLPAFHQVQRRRGHSRGTRLQGRLRHRFHSRAF